MLLDPPSTCPSHQFCKIWMWIKVFELIDFAEKIDLEQFILLFLTGLLTFVWPFSIYIFLAWESGDWSVTGPGYAHLEIPTPTKRVSSVSGKERQGIKYHRAKLSSVAVGCWKVNLEACQYWFDATHPPCPWLKKSPCFVVIGVKWNCYPGSAQREQQSDAFWVEEEGRLV